MPEIPKRVAMDTSHLLSMLWALFAKHGIERRRKVSKAKRERGKEEGSEPRVYRRHPIGLKQQAVERMNLGENVSALARELGVGRINLYRWRAELIKVPSGEPGVTYDPAPVFIPMGGQAPRPSMGMKTG